MKMLHNFYTNVHTKEVINTYYCVKCVKGNFYKYVINLVGSSHLLEATIILNYHNDDYLIKHRHHNNTIDLYKIKTDTGYTFMMRVSNLFKIDLMDTINSGLSILDRLLNLKAFI